MQTFKTYVTIDNPDQVILSNLPFQKGQRVEIVVFPLKQDLNALNRLRTLTDSFPQADPVQLVQQGRADLEDRSMV